jgi:hypothetical protein
MELTVREGTGLQLAEARSAREERLRDFWVAATPGGAALPSLGSGIMQAPGDEGRQLQVVLDWLAQVWALKWDNLRKEKAYMLVHDGFPTAQRLHLARRDPGVACACGSPNPGRAHCFWECPVALAVVAAINERLPPAAALTRDGVWLGQVPACQPALDPGVWAVVAVSAIWAMDRGRALLARWALSDPGEPPPPASRRVAVASSRAVLAFWASLQDFVVVQRGPSKWVGRVSTTHPFLKRVGDRLAMSMG